jgi:hypothetical protein
MLDMAKKSETGGKRPRPGASLQAYINPLLDQQLRAAASRSRRTLTAELELALETYLGQIGLWPPPEQPGDSGGEDDEPAKKRKK